MSIVEKAAARLRQTQTDRNGPRHNQPTLAERQSVTTPAATEDASRTQANGQPYEGRSHDKATDGTVGINMTSLRRAGLAPPEPVARQIAREYQRIKRPILASLGNSHASAARLTHGNRLMVTSAASGEGKTFSSFNLALSLAKERDYSVLLVDGDVLKPAISRALGLRDRKGLMDVLADDGTEPADTIVATDVPGFSVMPAGQRREETTELLSSRRMGWLVNELSADASRIVIFDSSPLLATAESQALALHVGQILVVVRAGYTERRAVESALSLIATPDRPISLVLNQTRKAYGDDYAGYYGMDYGGDDRAG